MTAAGEMLRKPHSFTACKNALFRFPNLSAGPQAGLRSRNLQVQTAVPDF